MFDLSQLDQPTLPDHSMSRVLRNSPTTLPEADYEKLQEHLEDCECALRPNSKLLAYVLANKLMNTRPVSGVHRDDVVVGGSRVTYVIDQEVAQTGLLSHRARTGLSSGVIPVASLLGATLIGMRAGGRAPLLYEDGTIRKLFVTGVQRPL